MHPALHIGSFVDLASPTQKASLVGFGVAAVLAGLVLSLGGRATRGTLSELRRRLFRQEGGQAPRAAAEAEAESFGELVGVTAATSVEALSLVLALTVLCLAPLLR